MNNLKRYEDFTNEKINWKGVVAGGLATIGSLGMSSCHAPIAMDVKTNTEVTYDVDKEGEVLFSRKVTVIIGKSSIDYALVYIKTIDGQIYSVIVGSWDSPVEFWTSKSKMKRGDPVTIHISNGKGYLLWNIKKLDLTNNYLAWDEATTYTGGWK